MKTLSESATWRAALDVFARDIPDDVQVLKGIL